MNSHISRARRGAIPRRWTEMIAGLTAVSAVFAFSSVAVADNIQDSITDSDDPVSLVAGSTTGGTASIRVVGNNSDGAVSDPGCNWDTGENPLVLNVVTPAGVTANPNPLSITTCGIDNTVTFTAGASAISGTATVTISSSPAGGGGYNNQVSIPITVTQPTPTNTAPSVAVTGVTSNATYNKGAVPVATCEVTDAEDGASSFAATLSAITGPYSTDGIGSQSASCSYSDAGGKNASASVTYSIVDSSVPQISYVLNPSTADGSNSWYKSTVTLVWTVSEPESPNSLQTTGCVDQNITADQIATTYSCSAASAGGSEGPVNVSIKRDATAPTVSLVGGPADGGSYVFGSVPATPTCSASDVTSGLAGACSVSGYATTVGIHTVTATATDHAGNTGSASVTYTVQAWDLKGFYNPVDGGDVYNSVKGGSTVPLKFEVFAEATELTDTSAVKSFQQLKVACTTGVVEDAIEVTSTGGTSLRYDTTGGQFIQNWQTPKQPGACYKVTVTTQDGSTRTALFKLK